MDEIPHPLVSESMDLFENLSQIEKSKIHFIHFNHTNPLLDERSKEYGMVKKAGFNLAKQGEKLQL